ncbi:MAG: hypothetical protein II163_04885 [Ruminococcus sp.]|nr:hypothetical protein [Ruminococcus sp.]MBQ1898482.1 hypothetical protein [Ruminococcus sp.]
MEIRLQKENEALVRELVGSGRIPHTIIIEGGDSEERVNAAVLLATGALCKEHDRPCLSCPACQKALKDAHPDFFIPKPTKGLKSGILSLKDLRDNYLAQMSVRPNEADIKVFLFRDADKLLREDAQNALLKTIEEPPQNLLFIFTTESAKSMLLTVRSRARVVTLRHTFSTDSDSEQAASSVIDGMISLYEYDMLKTLSSFKDKQSMTAALGVFVEKLRQALSFYSGLSTTDPEVKKLTRKLDRARIIALIEVTDQAVRKLKTNINLQLLQTWLSSQYRRITWQK